MESSPDQDKPSVVQRQRVDTIEFYRHYGRLRDGRLQVDFAALTLPDGLKTVSTGYGRNTLQLSGGTVIPELQAHTLGALFQTDLLDFTLIDLGGQDTKIIQVRRGRMQDFLTNDKCAASSGRYLENMAQVLGISLAELSQYTEAPVELSATCAVFGESELIGKIVEGYPIDRLAAGVNATIVQRVLPLLRDFSSEVLVFSGGVAQNVAIVRLLAQSSGAQVIVTPDPQFNGALGCALAAEKNII
jgi:predicted CoA-substrate-specific enzyme activase